MGSVEGNGLRVGSMCSESTCIPGPDAQYWAEDAVQLLMVQLGHSGLVDACGGSTYSMTLQNQPMETSQLPHLWL